MKYGEKFRHPENKRPQWSVTTAQQQATDWSTDDFKAKPSITEEHLTFSKWHATLILIDLSTQSQWRSLLTYFSITDEKKKKVTCHSITALPLQAHSDRSLTRLRPLLDALSLGKPSK